MKKLTLFFAFCFSILSFAQMPNIQRIWLNNGAPYNGTIANHGERLRVKINVSEQDKANDQSYFIAGETVVDQVTSKFEGKITITKFKASKKINKVYAEYDLAEEPTRKHSGILKGKLIYTFTWDETLQKAIDHRMKFEGKWISYDDTLNLRTQWSNN